MPNTTSASMVTMVMTGRLMAKSEMNMGYRVLRCGVGVASDGDRRARRDATGRAGQDDVAFRQAGHDLDPLGAGVAQTETDGDPLGLAVLDAGHAGRATRGVDRGSGHDQRLLHCGFDPAFRVQAGNQPSGGVRDRDEDRHLAGRRDPPRG